MVVRLQRRSRRSLYLGLGSGDKAEGELIFRKARHRKEFCVLEMVGLVLEMRDLRSEKF